MNKLLRRSAVCWVALLMTLCCGAKASEFDDALDKALSDVTTLQTELAIAQKYFSVMSREMGETQKCAARELLGASIDFREITEEARMIGKLVGEMKSAEDAMTARRYLGLASSRVVSISETDIAIVDEQLVTVTSPTAVAMAKRVRGKMIELRDIFTPYASKH
jgi:hypothetical protein